jgi:uncharacterized membrane protein YbhN (UPF0104 family)
MIEQKANIRKTFNYLIQALIILVTYGFIYRQVFVEKKLHDIAVFFNRMVEQRQAWFMISLILFLMLINWGVETIKWRLLIEKIEKISFLRAFKAVLTGVSVSIFTPNRTGDYLGRVFILQKANHVEGILITLIGSFAQIVVTISAGLFCFLSFLDQYLRLSYEVHNYLLIGLIVLIPCFVFLVILLYFKIGVISDFISRYFPHKWDRFIEYSRIFARYGNKELLGAFLLSFLRYVIFSTQFYLLLRIFGVEIPLSQAIILIPVIFLVMTMVPSIALIDLGIRGSVSIFIIGLYFKKSGIIPGDTELAILTSSTVLWMINLIIPAILGTFFVFNLKFFRK